MHRRNARLSSNLQHTAELWRNVEVLKDELYQTSIQPIKITTFYCVCVPQSNNLLNGRSAGTTLSRTTHKVICRYREDICVADWLIINGRRYDIIAYNDPYLNGERLEIFCEQIDEGVNND